MTITFQSATLAPKSSSDTWQLSRAHFSNFTWAIPGQFHPDFFFTILQTNFENYSRRRIDIEGIEDTSKKEQKIH